MQLSYFSQQLHMVWFTVAWEKVTLSKHTNITTTHVNAASDCAITCTHITSSHAQQCAAGRRWYFTVEMTKNSKRGHDLARLSSLWRTRV